MFALLLCTALAGVLLLASASASFTPAHRRDVDYSIRARSARTIRITDTAHLHLTKASGASLHETGPVSGTLAGSMHANLHIGGSFSGEFTIYAQGGTIHGHGTAIPHGAGRYESFSGSLVVTSGTGRYIHVHGHGGLFGTFDHRAFAFVVQTTGELSN